MKEPKIIFLDTETTGLTDKDRLVQLSYKVWKTDEDSTELFRPPEDVELSFEASSVHHISRAMVADKPLFSESPMKVRLAELFSEDSIVVAHNAAFDLSILKSEGLIPAKYICTLKVARFLDDEAVLSQHKLQYLRYAHGIEVEGQAHDARGDVAVLEKLFEFYLNKMDLQQMMEVSGKPSIIKRFSFGKYKGLTVAEVLQNDREYLEWFLATKKKETPQNEDWIYTLTQILGH